MVQLVYRCPFIFFLFPVNASLNATPYGGTPMTWRLDKPCLVEEFHLQPFSDLSRSTGCPFVFFNEYLKQVFKELPNATTAEDIEALLPWHYKMAFNK